MIDELKKKEKSKHCFELTPHEHEMSLSKFDYNTLFMHRSSIF